MRPIALLTLAGLALAPALAFAQPAPNPPGPGPGMMPGGHGHGGCDHGAWDQDGHMEGAEFLMKFYAANTTHDGHLTLAQAKAANLKMIVDHFKQIDVKNRGYVTFYDIAAWHLDDMAKHLEAKASQLRSQDQ